MGVIYKAVNKINGKFYIGQTRCEFKKRKREHYIDANLKRDSCPLFHAAIRKHGRKNFKWEILLETEDQWVLDKNEQIFIDNLKPEYNISNTAGGSYERTPEIRKKTSESHKRKYKNGYVSKLKGRKRSKETRMLISKNHADVSGINNPGYGKQYWLDKKHSEETKKIMSEKANKRPRDKFGRFIRKD